MKIILKKDWDIPIQPPRPKKNNNNNWNQFIIKHLHSFPKNETSEPIGHFVGRETEVDFLVDEIYRKNQGAFLICGYRGVGKTSFVYKALQTLEEKNANVIPIIINAHEINIQENSKPEISGENKKYRVLEALIRRLYAFGKHYPGKFKSEFPQLASLYQKITAKEYYDVSKAVQRTQSLSETLLSLKLSLVDGKSLNILLTYAILTVLTIIPDSLFQIKNIIWGATTLFLGFTLIWDFQKSITNSSSSEKIAETLYSHDNSFGNILFELEEFHHTLAKQNIKVIYVVDEIDKVKPADKFLEELYSSFKNLFTLSSAMFIFIGEEKAFETFANLSRDNRDPQYTYFTTKYFLARPTYNELSKFLDDITENISDIQKDPSKQEIFDGYKRQLCFRAYGDFYDLLQQIKGAISGFENGYPFINNPRFQFSPDSQIQKAITVVANKYIVQNQSKWVENEKVLKKLYQNGHELLNELEFSWEKVSGETKTTIENMATQDFGNFLIRNGIVNPRKETKHLYHNTPEEDEPAIKVDVYYYTFSGQYHIDIPNSLGDLTQYEQIFMDQMESLRVVSLAYRDIFESFQNTPKNEPMSAFRKRLAKWGVSFPDVDIYSMQEKIGTSLSTFTRDDVESFTNRATELRNKLINDATLIFSSMFQSVIPGTQSIKLLQHKGAFDFLAGDVRNKISQIPHRVIFDKNFSKQILIT